MQKRYWLTGALVAIAVVTGQAQAASTIEDRWLPFEGCWRPSEAPAGSLLCVVAEGAGVRLVEWFNGETVRETRIVADGRARSVSQEGCAGTETARWSADGRRLYLNTAMKCGEQIARNTTGLFAMVSARAWVSIQAIAVDNEAAVRTVRYELVESSANVPESFLSVLRANGLARETARQAANTPLQLGDVSEAARQVHGRAVEALLFERKQTFDLNGKQLLALSNAGVPAYLIDAIVAVSNPQKFAIRDTRPVQLQGDAPAKRRGFANDDYCDEFWYSRYCSSLRYGSLRGYYGYSPFGYYDPYEHYGYRTPHVVVIVNPGSDDDVPRHGRVSRNGYSKGRASSTDSDSGRRTSGSSGSASSSSTATGSNASGSSTTSSAGSSTSSSSANDRGKAKPRGGN